MSASASKKRRNAQSQEGMTPAQLAAKKVNEKKAKTRKTVLLSTGFVVIAAAIIVGLVLFLRADKQEKVAAQQDLYYAADYDVSVPVATVGEHQLSVPMYNYFYLQTCNQFGSYLSYFLDSTKSFSEQYYDEGQGVTWEDYFLDQTQSTVKEYYSVYDSALKDGYTLTEEDKATIENEISSMETSAKEAGFYKTDNYVSAMFGKGCTLENYRAYLELCQVYTSYYNQKREGFTPTKDEVDAAYASDPDSIDEINYSYVSFPEEALALAKEAAEAAAEDFPDDASSTLAGKTSFTGKVSEEAATWLFAAGRKQGDCKVFENETTETYYAIRYESRELHDYYPVNAYVVNIPFDSATETTAAADGAEATQKAEEKYNGILDGITEDMTDEEFSTLVSKYISSGVTLSSDLLKTNYKDASGEFLFDASRKAGDTEGFVLTENYRIVRYSSMSETLYQYTLMENKLSQDAYNEWHDAVTEGYTVTVDNTMLPYVNSDLKLNAAS